MPRSLRQRGQQLAQFGQLGTARHGGFQITEEARHVTQVARLAVAVTDTGEDANHLQVALHAHQVAGAEEVFEAWRQRDAGPGRLLPVTVQRGMHARLRPTDEGVLVQAGDIVGDRAVQGVLEVEDARVGLAEHQIARHIVPMDEHPRLLQRAAYQQVADPFPAGQRLALQLHAEVAGQVPVGEQLQLAAQHRFVVGRQDTGDIDLLEGDQRIQGRFEQLVGIPGMKHVEVGLPAQVTEQQETVLQILGENPRHMHAGSGEQSGDLDERSAVFLGRRRVHHHQAAVPSLPAEITTEAGVATGRDQFGGGHFPPTFGNEQLGQTRVQPAIQLLETGIIRHLRGSPRP